MTINTDTLLRGHVVRFRSGLTVALAETFNHGGTWRVLVLRPVDDLSIGDTTYMSHVTLSQGELLDWAAVEEALDHLFELYHSAGRIEEDILSRTTGQ